MTNKFAEWKDEALAEISTLDPVLCDITNVYRYVKGAFSPREIVRISEMVPNLPWSPSWFEFKVEKGRTMGVFAMNDEEGKINYAVFSDCLKDQIGGHLFLGWEALSHNDGEYYRHSVGVHNDLAGLPDENKDIVLDFISMAVFNVIYACTFAHCRNVTYYEKNHPEKLRKRNEKRGKLPQETYRILDIDGLQRQAKSEATESEGELKRALHICRDRKSVV